MKLRPNEIELSNEGAAYEPADQEALRDSMEITEGYVVPPIVYRNPFSGKWMCLEGNNRLLVLKKKGWGETPIDVVPKDVPTKVRTKKDLLEWSLIRRAHVNGKRRRVPASEWASIFTRLRDELGWSQAQIARQCGWDEADVSRLLSTGTTPADHRKAIRERENVGAHQDPPEARDEVSRRSMDAFHRAIQDRFRRAEAGDREVIQNLRWAHWNIGRKLLALGVEILDPKQENPES